MWVVFWRLEVRGWNGKSVSRRTYRVIWFYNRGYLFCHSGDLQRIEHRKPAPRKLVGLRQTVEVAGNVSITEGLKFERMVKNQRDALI